MIETFWRWIYRFDNSSLMELIYTDGKDDKSKEKSSYVEFV